MEIIRRGKVFFLGGFGHQGKIFFKEKKTCGRTCGCYHNHTIRLEVQPEEVKKVLLEAETLLGNRIPLQLVEEFLKK